MTPAARRHLELERQLVLGRALGNLSEAQEDSLLEEMGDIWWSLTDAEREEANHRAAVYVQASRRLGLFLRRAELLMTGSSSTMVTTDGFESSESADASTLNFCVEIFYAEGQSLIPRANPIIDPSAANISYVATG